MEPEALEGQELPLWSEQIGAAREAADAAAASAAAAGESAAAAAARAGDAAADALRAAVWMEQDWTGPAGPPGLPGPAGARRVILIDRDDPGHNPPRAEGAQLMTGTNTSDFTAASRQVLASFDPLDNTGRPWVSAAARHWGAHVILEPAEWTPVNGQPRNVIVGVSLGGGDHLVFRTRFNPWAGLSGGRAWDRASAGLIEAPGHAQMGDALFTGLEFNQNPGSGTPGLSSPATEPLRVIFDLDLFHGRAGISVGGARLATVSLGRPRARPASLWLYIQDDQTVFDVDWLVKDVEPFGFREWGFFVPDRDAVSRAEFLSQDTSSQWWLNGAPLNRGADTFEWDFLRALRDGVNLLVLAEPLPRVLERRSTLANADGSWNYDLHPHGSPVHVSGDVWRLGRAETWDGLFDVNRAAGHFPMAAGQRWLFEIDVAAGNSEAEGAAVWLTAAGALMGPRVTLATGWQTLAGAWQVPANNTTGMFRAITDGPEDMDVLVRDARLWLAPVVPPPVLEIAAFEPVELSEILARLGSLEARLSALSGD